MQPEPRVVTVHVGTVVPGAPVATDCLPGSERRRIGRITHEPTRIRTLHTWLAAAAMISAATGVSAHDVRIERHCTHCGDPAHGRPTLPGTGLHLSVSHSNDAFAVALAAVPVGVDVERSIDAPWDAGMRRLVLAPGEAEPADRTQLWTRKEAVLKCVGDGLRSPLAGLALDGARVRSWAEHPDLAARVALHGLRAPHGYTASLATLDPVRVEQVAAPEERIRHA